MYRDVLPMKDHLAMICSINQTSTMEIDGQVIVRAPSSENVDLVSAAAAAVWADTHITLTRTLRSGISRLDLEREVLERVLTLCPSGHKVEIIFNDEESYTQAQCAAHGNLIDEELTKWENILEMVRQVRGLDVKGFGHEEGSAGTRELAWRSAQGNLEKVIQVLAVSPLGGEPAPLPPE
jgi:hypothetical protein